MADYSHIIADVRGRYQIKVKRWRKNMSGKAWLVFHQDGRVVKWIEAPYPKTPISLSVFLHEVGHHAVGFETYKKRCEEEYHVWVWALDEMKRQGVDPDQKVRTRFELSMRYAVSKALRRGIKTLPDSLLHFATGPAQSAA